MSPLAEIVATLLICELFSILIELLAIYFTIVVTARSIPFFISDKLIPVYTLLRAYLKIDLAKIVAVVVPSPAWSFALSATDLIKLAPMLANLSLN